MANPGRSADLCKVFGELVEGMSNDEARNCLLLRLLLSEGGARWSMSIVSAAVGGVERLLADDADEEDVVGALGDVCGAAEVTGATVYAGGSNGEPGGELRPAYRWGSAIRRVGDEGFSLWRFGRWLASFARGQTVAARVADLPPDEQALLAPLGIGAVVAVPVVRGEQLESVIVFEDTADERQLPDEHISSLAQAGHILAVGLRLWGCAAEAAGKGSACEELLAEASDLAVKVIGRDCKIRYWNRGCEELYGFSAAEAVGSDVVDLIVPPEIHTLARQAIDQGFRTGRALPGRESRAVGKDGAERTVFAAAQVAPGDGEELMYLIDVDLTDIMRRQDEKALLQRQLHGARKMETISHLIGGVAHHFNNALTVIQGNAELIRKSHADDQDLRELIEQILLATMVSSQLTSQLLSYSRLDRHEKTDVDVHAVVETVMKQLLQDADPRPRISTDLRARPHTIQADEKQLRSALTNLGINACEATAAGGEILLATEIVELDEAFCASYPQDIVPGEYLCLTVRDTGVGMDNQTLQRAFEPFFTTKPFGKGHGLGLASVYGCALSHNGAVSLTSELGKGSTVQLFLPLVQPDQGEAEQEPAGPVVKRGAVMIVDNEVSARQTLEMMLSGAGYEVVLFGSGRDAVDYYRANADGVDLVVVDVNLPEMNGRETFSGLKEINPQVRGLMSSGLLLASDAQAILDEGARGFLSKPYRSAETLQQVARAIKD